MKQNCHLTFKSQWLKRNNLASFLDKNWDEKQQKYVDRGMYDPRKRYGFKNITDEDFTFTWNSNPITVKPGVEIELPEHMAILATHKIVDQVMGKIAHEDTERLRKEMKDPYARSPLGIAMGVPTARKPFEDKVLRELKVDEQSPQIQILRAQTKEQIVNDLTNAQKPPEPLSAALGGLAQMGNPTAPAEFSELPRK